MKADITLSPAEVTMLSEATEARRKAEAAYLKHKTALDNEYRVTGEADMRQKMTPGPWTAAAGWDDDVQIIAGGEQIALVTNYPQNKIDARAIAALPELVEAARKLVMRSQLMPGADVSRLRLTTTIDGEDIQAVRRILARIEGEDA